MRKVCIITTVHPSDDIRIFHKEAKTLFSAGYDVTLIAQCEKSEVKDGIKIISLENPESRMSRVFFLTKKAYNIALKQKADIYHFHDPELLPWMLMLKYRSGARVIYDVHEDYPKQILSKEWIPKIIRKPVSLSINLIEKIFSRKFNYIFTATPHIAKRFKKNVIDIRNYPIISTNKENANSNTRKNTNIHDLIYIGGMTRIRGIKEIIRSTSFVNPNCKIKLKLVGKILDEDFEKELRSLAEWNKVDYLGYLPFERAQDELKNVKVALACFLPLPNHINSIPNKMFEYMEKGVPIISSNFPLWKELVEGNNCGLTADPSDPRDIARAIEYLLENCEKAKNMGANGRKVVLEKYNWEMEGEKMLKIYDELMCRKNI